MEGHLRFPSSFCRSPFLILTPPQGQPSCTGGRLPAPTRAAGRRTWHYHGARREQQQPRRRKQTFLTGGAGSPPEAWGLPPDNGRETLGHTPRILSRQPVLQPCSKLLMARAHVTDQSTKMKAEGHILCFRNRRNQGELKEY